MSVSFALNTHFSGFLVADHVSRQISAKSVNFGKHVSDYVYRVHAVYAMLCQTIRLRGISN